MKKIYLTMIAIITLGIPVQSANTLRSDVLINNKIEQHDHKRHHRTKNYIQKERELEIEYRLDKLKAQYKRDKDRLDASNLDKYDKKRRKKELEYQYKREKERLKYEKEKVKKGNFYTH